MLLLSGVLAAGIAATGCSSPKTEAEKPSGGPTGGPSGEPKKSKEVKAVEAKGSGTLKGQVKFSGDAPKPAPLDFKKTDKKTDIAVCEAGSEEERTDPTWRVGPNKGVKNVIVWVEPAVVGQYFVIPDDLKKPAKEKEVVKIDQPHCAFVPHVEVFYPSYFDATAKKQTATGQKLEVANSASIDHNTKTDPGNTLVNKATNDLIPHMTKNPVSLNFKPGDDKKPGDFDVVKLACTIHPWMNAYVLVVDNPYYAITDGDGNFEIKGVPAGAEVRSTTGTSRSTSRSP